MKNSRATQPYRKGGARQPGLAMKAMQKGRTAGGFNPMDVQRAIAKGGNAPRTMAQPVGPAKGVASTTAAAPKASPFQLHKNATGNERAGQTFRSVAGKSKSGVEGTFHVYSGGKRVFVPAAGAEKAKSFAKRARSVRA